MNGGGEQEQEKSRKEKEKKKKEWCSYPLACHHHWSFLERKRKLGLGFFKARVVLKWRFYSFPYLFSLSKLYAIPCLHENQEEEKKKKALFIEEIKKD